VFEAANALLAKIRTVAGARLGCAAEQVDWRMDAPELPTDAPSRSPSWRRMARFRPRMPSPDPGTRQQKRQE
jgi:hypothetical protein